MLKDRLANIRKKLEAEKLDAFLISSASNRFYISGFHGSNGLLYISREKAHLYSDFRYIEQATEQAPEFEIVEAGRDGLIMSCAEALGKTAGGRIGIEKNFVTLAEYNKLEEAFSDTTEFVHTEQIVESLRRVKYPDEIALLKKAQEIAEKAFEEILPKLRPDMTEKEAAIELDIAMLRNGSGPIAFDTIVGAGPNAALPHHFPDDTPLGEGRSIVIDFGASYEWYNSDTTRTVFIGSAPDDLKEIYQIVLEAQELAIDSLDSGKTGVEVDMIARKHISDRGHAEHFGHGLGHGIGIDVHEGPTLSPKSANTLEAFNIFSVEPGIYIPGLGGVRIEDLCWIKPEGGFEDITNVNKDLVVL
jgi:Xaa-Pro aminopeptidase